MEKTKTEIYEEEMEELRKKIETEHKINQMIKIMKKI